MAEIILSIFLGIGLAAAVGFRVFVPLFLLSLAAHYQIIPIAENWEWIGGVPAMVTLGLATFLEIAAYLVPWLDNALDTIAVPLAAVAGTTVMLSTITELSPLLTWSLAIIAGGGTASVIKTGNSSARLGSSLHTAGFANPVIGAIETVGAILLTVISFISPVIAVLIVVALFYFLRKIYRFVFPRHKGKANKTINDSTDGP